MDRGAFRRGGRNNNRNVSRIVNSTLRSHHLTSQPCWILSRNARHNTPPSLINDVSYVRKVRFVFVVTNPSTFSYVVTPTTLNTQIFNTEIPFTNVKISGVEVWGPTSTTVEVTPGPLTIQGSSGPLKNFSSSGTFGTLPSHVKLNLCEKDAAFLPATSTTNLVTVRLSTTLTTLPAGDNQVIIDVLATFSGTPDKESFDGFERMDES